MDLEKIKDPKLIGVVGGGQLGKFFVQAAQNMGYQVAVLDPDEHSPAMSIADIKIISAYDDFTNLARLGHICTAVTTEFENVPAESFKMLSVLSKTSPHADALHIAQNRVREKTYLKENDFELADFVIVNSEEDLICDLYPAILKLAGEGYDGKGQCKVNTSAEAIEAYRSFGSKQSVLEKKINFDCEVSVILARNPRGEIVTYPVIENQHQDGILKMSLAPARISFNQAKSAKDIAIRLAKCLNYVGVLAVEFFVVGDRILINEIAPRPHNSGHLTMLAADHSQFEQQVRCLCNLPLANSDLKTSSVMINVLGDVWNPNEPNWNDILAGTSGHLELYGKKQARPKRKMGHITFLNPWLDVCIEQANMVLPRLYGNAA